MSQAGRRPETAAVISQEDLRKIIVDGDARLLVHSAEQLGGALQRGGLRTSQIRRIFGAVREIEMDWPRTAAESESERARAAKRQLTLLEPKIRYQQERFREVKPLAAVLIPAIRLVQDDRQRFQHFVELFEATIAFHRAAGGSNS